MFHLPKNEFRVQSAEFKVRSDRVKNRSADSIVSTPVSCFIRIDQTYPLCGRLVPRI